MKTKFIIIISVFFIFTNIIFCEQPSEFKRDNPKDPTLSIYDPVKPHRVNVEIIDKVNNIIKISWDDASQDYSEFSVQKKINDGNYFYLTQNIKTTSIIDRGEIANTYTYRVFTHIYGKTSAYTESLHIYIAAPPVNTSLWIPWSSIKFEEYFWDYYIINFSDDLNLIALSTRFTSEIKFLEYNLQDQSHSLKSISRINTTYPWGIFKCIKIDDQRYFILEYTGDFYTSYFTNTEDLTYDDENCPHFPSFIEVIKWDDNQILFCNNSEIGFFDIDKREVNIQADNTFSKTRFKLFKYDNDHAIILGGSTTGIYTFNLSNKEWTLTNSLKRTYNYDYTVLPLGNDKYLIAGGITNFTSEAEIFDFGKNSVVTLPKYKGDRFFGALMLPSDTLLLLSTAGSSSSLTLFTEIMDLNKGAWTLIDSTTPWPPWDMNPTKGMYAKDDGNVIIILTGGDIYQSQIKLF